MWRSRKQKNDKLFDSKSRFITQHKEGSLKTQFDLLVYEYI